MGRPGRSPGSRIVLLPAPPQPYRPVAHAGFVPDYSDGVAADSHRLPWALFGHHGRPSAEGTVSKRLLDFKRLVCPPFFPTQFFDGDLSQPLHRIEVARS